MVWVAASTVGSSWMRPGVSAQPPGSPGTSARGSVPGLSAAATDWGTAALMRSAEGS